MGHKFVEASLSRGESSVGHPRTPVNAQDLKLHAVLESASRGWSGRQRAPNLTAEKGASRLARAGMERKLIHLEEECGRRLPRDN